MRLEQYNAHYTEIVEHIKRIKRLRNTIHDTTTSVKEYEQIRPHSKQLRFT